MDSNSFCGTAEPKYIQDYQEILGFNLNGERYSGCACNVTNNSSLPVLKIELNFHRIKTQHLLINPDPLRNGSILPG
jgi:uncharacterized protein (DUF608 family)